MALEERVEPEAPQEVVHEGQAAEGVGDEREVRRLRHPRLLCRRKLTAA
jgi:hypothetical protein